MENNEIVKVFGFNTTNGGMFVMQNTSVEKIKAELKKSFPNWSDAVIDKVVSNKAYYSMPIAVKTENGSTKKGVSKRSSLSVNGYSLNDVLKLGLSVHTYKINAYRYWGNVTKKIFNDKEVGAKYASFEKTYADVVKVVKAKNRPPKGVINSKVIDMLDQMVSLRESAIKMDIIKTDANEPYMSSDEKKLGFSVLMDRIGEMSEGI